MYFEIDSNQFNESLIYTNIFFNNVYEIWSRLCLLYSFCLLLTFVSNVFVKLEIELIWSE